MNRGEIITEILRQVPETDATTSNEYLNPKIKQAEIRLASWCKLILDTHTYNEDNDDSLGDTAETTSEVLLPTNFLDFDYDRPMTYAGKRLKKKSIQWLQDLYEDEYSSVTGCPEYVATKEDYKTLLIRPIIDSTNADEDLVFPYVRMVDVMETDSDEPWEGIPAFFDHHILIANYVIYLEKLGAGELAQAETSFKQDFANEIDMLRMKAKRLLSGNVSSTMVVDLGGYINEYEY